MSTTPVLTATQRVIALKAMSVYAANPPVFNEATGTATLTPTGLAARIVEAVGPALDPLFATVLAYVVRTQQNKVNQLQPVLDTLQASIAASTVIPTTSNQPA